MKSINKHGLESPIDWEDIIYNWQAIDANGDVCTYEKKPVKGRTMWHGLNYNLRLVAKVNPPKDFSECLWQRPKTESK